MYKGRFTSTGTNWQYYLPLIFLLMKFIQRHPCGHLRSGHLRECCPLNHEANELEVPGVAVNIVRLPIQDAKFNSWNHHSMGSEAIEWQIITGVSNWCLNVIHIRKVPHPLMNPHSGALFPDHCCYWWGAGWQVWSGHSLRMSLSLPGCQW